MHVSIRIKGHLDPSWQGYLEGLAIVPEADGISRLSGTLQDPTGCVYDFPTSSEGRLPSIV